MSFKDKPLKKIVADTRVTIDALHNDIVKDFQREREEYLQNITLETQLQKEYEESQSEEIQIQLKALRKEIKKYNASKETEYYFDTGELLTEYYEKKDGKSKQENQELTVLDFMNQTKEKQNDDKDSLINTYMATIDDNTIPKNINYNIEQCPLCDIILTMKNIESVLLCEKCGYTEHIIIHSEKVSYKDPPRESSYFAYKRINHFNEWLAQFQAKETTDIPQQVYDGIMIELKKNKFIKIEDISYKNVREILKKLKYNKYYEHIPHIINILNGKKAPILTRKYEEQLRMMFKEIQTPFMEHCPENRKNFLSYSYVLHKFCQLLELDDLLMYFPLLKSREKLQQQDKIWEKICNSLQWQYIPSI
uniref:Viral late gene transcription factor 3 zinc ribbon domain-containing protein n=1 Tax=viral metagenome TaxID=1070528 RepID=A0A6C0L392_9ZZZZ|tara:strand:+ start:10682 stop:11773 length:1092 start_codon:yes stop_codon:yes gene_type:complete